MRAVRYILFFIAAITLSGCVLAPEGTRDEQSRADATAKAHQYDPPYEQRTIPDLPPQPTWRDVLQRAFLVNGDLEAAYFEWRAALERIPQVANYPNTNLAPSFSYLFSGGQMKAWDRTTINVGFDPMENLSFPTKVAQAGKVALDNARSAGARFQEKKFEVQRKVLDSYLSLSLMEQKIHIRRDNVELLKLLSDTAADRVRAGGSQQDLLRAQTQHRLAQDELESMIAEQHAMLAMLNGMLARSSDAAIEIPTDLPPPRALAADDAKLIAVATDRSPQLARLAHDVQGRSDALELARQAYIPDINPFAAFTGGMSQAIGAMVVIPTTIPEIQGRIDEERAMLRSTQAMLRQAKNDRAASFVAALFALRNGERRARVYETIILPRAEQALAGARQAYATGTGSFSDLVESQRTLLDIRLMIVESHIEREMRLAELEEIAGVDVETLK
jgi:outer membrane protein TolC